MDKRDMRRNILIFVMLGLSIVDTLIALFKQRSGILTGLLKPAIVSLQFKTLRSNFALLMLNIKDSAVTLSVIFLFILYFSFFASLIFYSTFEGTAITNRISDSYWAFTVLLTTENYPDVMLLAYNSRYYSVFFFLVFVVIGVFYLLSILLAIVFDNYKNRVKQLGQQKICERIKYIKIIFDKFDEEELTYLTYDQAKDFFQFVLDLDFKKKKHRKTFVRII